MRRTLLALFALSAVALAPKSAWAGKYDVDLSRLGRVENAGTPTAMVIKDNEAFRSLSSELGSVIAPRPMDPSESLGLSGFALTADIGINTISYKERYWTDTTSAPNGVIPTLTITGRKGLWPGLEIGGGATKLFDSKMWGMNGYAKFALNEGFRLVPSIAVRGIFSTLLGARDLRINTMGLDASISHVFGVGGTVSLTPYGGYQALLILARSSTVDSTPGIDEFGEQINDLSGSEFAFQRQDVIVRHRPFVGLRMIFGILRVGVEAMFAPGGRSSSSEAPSPTASAVTVTDRSKFQQHYTISFGLDF